MSCEKYASSAVSVPQGVGAVVRTWPRVLWYHVDPDRWINRVGEVRDNQWINTQLTDGNAEQLNPDINLSAEPLMPTTNGRYIARDDLKSDLITAPIYVLTVGRWYRHGMSGDAAEGARRANTERGGLVRLIPQY
ncbi:MAG TPA: hypothetical protein VFU07_04980 [Candidatus Lumbricidophila sp.]|nr:hypothetical protein [Candidatus Lumbricidophila sp.]